RRLDLMRVQIDRGVQQRLRQLLGIVRGQPLRQLVGVVLGVVFGRHWPASSSPCLACPSPSEMALLACLGVVACPFPSTGRICGFGTTSSNNSFCPSLRKTSSTSGSDVIVGCTS